MNAFYTKATCNFRRSSTRARSAFDKYAWHINLAAGRNPSPLQTLSQNDLVTLAYTMRMADYPTGTSVLHDIHNFCLA